MAKLVVLIDNITDPIVNFPFVGKQRVFQEDFGAHETFVHIDLADMDDITLTQIAYLQSQEGILEYRVIR